MKADPWGGKSLTRMESSIKGEAGSFMLQNGSERSIPKEGRHESLKGREEKTWGKARFWCFVRDRLLQGGEKFFP